MASRKSSNERRHRRATEERGPLPRMARSLRRLANQATAFDPEGAGEASTLAGWLQRPEIAIVFAGLYSTGKTALLNALIGRNLLWVSPDPSTGTACWLRGGTEDQAVLVVGGEERTIPCTPEAIRDAIVLTGSNGSDRVEDARNIDRLEVFLRGFPLGERLCLIDTAGIGVDRAMDKKLLQTIFEGDLLIWMMRISVMTNQMDTPFFVPCVTEMGAEGVAVVVNEWLKGEDEESWRQFLLEDWPVYQERMRNRSTEFGFPRGRPPEMLAVAALAAASAADGRFGRQEMRDWLAALSDPSNSRLARVRLFRAARRLERLAKHWHSRAISQARNARRRRRRYEEWQTKVERFRLKVEEAVGKCMHRFDDRVRQAANQLAEQVIAGQLTGQNYYGRRLSTAVQDAGRNSLRELFAALKIAADRTNQRCLTPAQIAHIETVMAIGTWTIHEPPLPRDRRGGLEWFVHELWDGSAEFNRQRQAERAAAMKERVRRAATPMIASWQERRPRLLSLILEACVKTVLPPKESGEDDFLRLAKRARRLARDARRAAEPEEPV